MNYDTYLDLGLDLQDVLGFEPQTISDSDAWVGHLPFANYIVQKCRPTVFVELGVYTGNSYFAFCQSIAKHKLNTKAFGVDSWQGDIHMGPQSPAIYDFVSAQNREYGEFSKLIRKTFDEALSDFAPKSIDLLHLDGTHTYDEVRNDFQNWLPKLRDGAIVLFHDTNVYKQNFGVHKFWKEVKEEFPSFEFLHSNGLGVLQIPDKLSPAKLPFDSLKSLETIIQLFSALGERQLYKYRNSVMNSQIEALIKEKNLAEQSAQDLTNHNQALMASLSWKYTAWLRKLARPFLR